MYPSPCTLSISPLSTEEPFLWSLESAHCTAVKRTLDSASVSYSRTHSWFFHLSVACCWARLLTFLWLHFLSYKTGIIGVVMKIKKYNRYQTRFINDRRCEEFIIKVFIYFCHFLLYYVILRLCRSHLWEPTVHFPPSSQEILGTHHIRSCLFISSGPVSLFPLDSSLSPWLQFLLFSPLLIVSQHTAGLQTASFRPASESVPFTLLEMLPHPRDIHGPHFVTSF